MIASARSKRRSSRVISLRARQFRRGRRRDRRLRPPLQRLERFESPRVALSTPVPQRRRVQAFPPKDRRDAAGIRRPIRLGQDPRLLRRREPPTIVPAPDAA